MENKDLENETKKPVVEEPVFTEEDHQAEPEELVVKKLGENSKLFDKKKPKVGTIISIVLIILFILVCTCALFVVIYARQIFGDEIGDRILGEGVENGFKLVKNMFIAQGWRIMFSLIVIAVTLLVFFVLKGIVTLSTNKSKKSRTIGSLIKSCVKYVAIIADIAIILAIWGVNVASIIAGLGVMTLIIGLGAQTLIKDIIAGLFIVFDDYYSVGETVVIGGFRGVVVEIGLKTTKLDNGLGEIKCITNSSIDTCINISRSLNTISVTAGFGYNEDLKKVEAVIARELPKIKEKIPKIVDGPHYKGVSAMNDSSIDLKFACKCKYSDKFQVERDLNRELYLMYVENDITIPYPQITINPQDPQDREEATEAEALEAEKLNEENRKIAEKKKKESFLKRAKDSFVIEISGDEDNDD